MPPELTYPGLRCILEYLELNKRLHIASRSPALRQCDKSIPVHIDKLSFDGDRIVINHVTYGLFTGYKFISQDDPLYTSLPEDKKLTPGDIPMGFPLDEWHYKYIVIQFQTWERSASKPCRLKYNLASKQMANELLGYQRIFVKKLSFSSFVSPTVLRLPRDFIVCARIIDVGPFFDRLILLINPLCFPFKEVKLSVSGTDTMNHPAVRTTETLDVRGLKDDFPLEELTNMHTTLKKYFDRVQVMRLIGSWVKDSRDIGSSFTIDFQFRGRNIRDAFLEEIKEEFGGEMKNLAVSHVGYLAAAHCVSIPTNHASELNIYAMPGAFKIKMEVMALSTAPVYQPLERPFHVLNYPPNPIYPGRRPSQTEIMTLTFSVCCFVAVLVFVMALSGAMFWKRMSKKQ